MATGEEEPTSAPSPNVPTRWTPEVEERDQYQEGESDSTKYSCRNFY